MASTKTTKAFSKRLKVTRNGKIKSRKPGKNHYNAKKSGAHLISKRTNKDVEVKQKEMNEFMPHN